MRHNRRLKLTCCQFATSTFRFKYGNVKRLVQKPRGSTTPEACAIETAPGEEDSGLLENPRIRAAVCRLLEGGTRALLERERHYRLNWGVSEAEE